MIVSKYKREKEDDKDRDRYKAWFVDHEQFFDLAKLGEYWIKDHKVDAEMFLSDFKMAYNAVAKRTLATLIKD